MAGRRITIAALSAILAGSGCSAVSGPESQAGPAGQTPSASVERQPLPDILTFYPAAAREAGVGGEAMLRCKLSPHYALEDCRLEKETPEGYGFGQAALAMAAQSEPSRYGGFEGRSDEQRTVTFKASPLRIEPDLRPAPSIVFDAVWIRRPTPEEVKKAFPRGAQSDTGRVRIGCDIAIDTRVKNCVIYQETPAGQGFGEAALKLSKSFRLQPNMIKGKPSEGGFMGLVIGFKR